MSVDWAKLVHDTYAAMPHPKEPRLTVGEYAQAVKLATKAKFGGHASAHEAAAFMSEFKGMNESLLAQGKATLSPEEYGHLLERIAPISFAFHGRPPTMAEVVRHRDAEPSAISKYYGDLHHATYPVPAREIAKYLMLAEPFSQQHIGRKPNPLEAARFALGGLSMDAVAGYYQTLGGAQMRPNLTPPVAGDWGSVRPGVGPPETGISERRKGGDRRNPESGWGRDPAPDRRQPPPQSGGGETGAAA